MTLRSYNVILIVHPFKDVILIVTLRINMGNTIFRIFLHNITNIDSSHSYRNNRNREFDAMFIQKYYIV